MRQLIGPDGKPTYPRPGDVIAIDHTRNMMTIMRGEEQIRFKKLRGAVEAELLIDWLPTRKIALEGCFGMLEFFIGRRLMPMHTTRAEEVHSWEIQ